MKSARWLTVLATVGMLRAAMCAEETSRADAPARAEVRDAGVALERDAGVALNTVPDWVRASALDGRSSRGRRSIARIVGTYGRHFEIQVFEGGDTWVPVSARDCVRVERDGHDALRITLSLAFDNGHSCYVGDAPVVPIAEDRYRVEIDGCSILLLREGNELVFASEFPTSCATSATCGARGRIEGSRVPAASMERCDVGD